MELKSNIAAAAPTQKNKTHKLELDNHRSLAVSGVNAVPVFSDKSLTVELDGETLIVSGHDLSIKTLDTENGKLNVSGYVTALKYTSSTTPSSFLKKVFK